MSPQAANTNRPCPICGKPADQSFHPFCSRRCADVDLNRWLGEIYTAPCVGESEESLPIEEN